MTPDYETRSRYVHKMARLHLWHVRHLLEKGEIRSEDLPRALATRANLYRLTDLWDGDPHHDPLYGWVDPVWEPLAARLAEMVRASPADDTSRLEEEGFALLWPLFEKRLPRDVGPPPANPFVCWTFAQAWEGVGDRPAPWGTTPSPTHLAYYARRALRLPIPPVPDFELHFANALMPRSPFEDMPALAGTLLALLRHVKTNYPFVKRMWCGSWLNTRPVFVSLFPPEWTRRPIVKTPGNYSNWWGQLMTKTGDLNDERAAEFRRTGKFALPGLLCHAKLDRMIEHLKTNHF